MIKIKLINENKIINEVSKEAYEQITPDMRIVMTDSDNLEAREYEQQVGRKPNGLWYGMGTSWINWVKMEMPDWEKKHAYELVINERYRESGLFMKITTLDHLYEFQHFYKANHPINKASDKVYLIDWEQVANNGYFGIEIAPFRREAAMRMPWYYGWDVPSGCIWKTKIIDDLRPLGGQQNLSNQKI